MNKRYRKLLALMLSASMVMPIAGTAVPAFAEETAIEDVLLEEAEADGEEYAAVELETAAADELQEELFEDLIEDSTLLLTADNEVSGFEFETDKITNTNKMFKVIKAGYDGAVLTFTLSGTGYHYLFAGTYEQAKSNGANTENWIQGVETIVDGEKRYEFSLKLTEGVTYYPIIAISNSYYEKYTKGENTLARAFYPRQFTVDLAGRTLITGDYDAEEYYSVVNTIKMFKPSAVASAQVTGGPNSNNYLVTMKLPMESTSYDSMYLGTYEEAVKAEESIALGEDQSFTFTAAKYAAAGSPETIMDKDLVVCFRSASKGTWYERLMHIDSSAHTITFSEHYADYSAVDALIPADLSAYTEESAKALTDARAAINGKFGSQQSEVDAAAETIKAAVAALVLKTPETEKPAETEKTAETEKPANTAPKTGSKVTVSSQTYQVKADKTVAYVGTTKKSAKSITVPDSVKIKGKTYKVSEIKASALKNNTKVTTITIGKNVTKIGASAFSGCKALTKVTIKSTKIKSIGKEAFKSAGSKNYKKLTVKVPSSKLSSYKKLLKNAKLSSKAKVSK